MIYLKILKYFKGLLYYEKISKSLKEKNKDYMYSHYITYKEFFLIFFLYFHSLKFLNQTS